MKVVRLISLYDKKTKKLVREVNIDFIDFHILKKIFNPPLRDSLMYDFYWVEKEEAKLIKEYVSFDFELDKYIYQVECFQAD